MWLNASQAKILTFRSTKAMTLRSLWVWLKELTVSIVNPPDSQVRLKKMHILRVFFRDRLCFVLARNTHRIKLKQLGCLRLNHERQFPAV